MRIFVSGPSGAGKSTIINALLEKRPDLVLSVSYTTRAPRPSEVNGREYFFVSRPDFEKMISDGEFLEWAHVHLDYYGTSLKWVEDTEHKGLGVIFDIDIQGVRQAKARGSDGCFAMIVPPDLKTLENRLKMRATESKETLAIRLENAVRELKAVDMYDYIVINDDLEKAVRDLNTIVSSYEMSREFMMRRIKWIHEIK